MTTRIGVLSDSHVKSLDALPKQLIDTLATVDLIVHAGDFTALQVYEDLKRLGETKAVRGNMDNEDIRGLLPETEQLVIEGKKVGVVHGFGAPWGIEERVRAKFDDVDVIIFGHSHDWKLDKDSWFVEDRIYANCGTWCDDEKSCTFVETQKDYDNRVHMVRVMDWNEGNVSILKEKELPL